MRPNTEIYKKAEKVLATALQNGFRGKIARTPDGEYVLRLWEEKR